MNLQIRMPTVRLIDETGKMLGILNNSDAQKMAQDKGLDLVEIDPNQHPPICRIMDFGKFKYAEEKKQKELRRINKPMSVKEIQFSPNVDVNDANIKSKKIREFLSEGHKVKISMRFKGRDLAHVDLGKKTFESTLESFKDVSKVENKTEFSGNTLSVLISPLKRG